MNKQQYLIVIFILGLITALGALSIDMYLPAFSAIAADLHTDVSRIQLSLSSYFLGISFGQLLYGPLLDRYGRKKPLFIGLSVYVVASLACAATHSVNALVGLRLVQALGGCAGIVSARALVRDIFPVSETAKVFSLLLLVLIVSPMFAPTVGGYVSSAFGWHYIFIILATVAILVIVACAVWLPEGRHPDTDLSLKPKHIINNFYSVFKHPMFYTYAITGGLGNGSQYAYLAGSSYVFISFYHVDQKHFGWIFAFIAAGLIGSSQLNSLLLRNFNSERIMRTAFMCQTIIGVALFATTFSGLMTEAWMIITIFVFLCCQGFITPNTSALTLAPFARQAGIASALMGFLQLGIGALASATVSFFNEGRLSPVPMTCTMMVFAIIGLIYLIISSRTLPKQEFVKRAFTTERQML